MTDFAAALQRVEQNALDIIDLAVRVPGDPDLDRAACRAIEYLEVVAQ